jgi:hypothetical protein
MRKKILLFLSITVLAFTAQSNATLIHSYEFNSNANDSVGSANGTLIGGATVSGGVLHLDGVSGYVQFASQIVPTSGSYSVILSALETAPVANYVELISQGFSGGPGFYIGHDPSGNIRVSDSWVNTGVPFPPAGTFNTFVLTVDAVAGDSKLYIDGTLVATLGIAISTTSGGDDTIFGRQFDPYAEYFGGELDNIRIYDTALTASEVAGVPDSGSTLAFLVVALAGLICVHRVQPAGRRLPPCRLDARPE